MVNIIYLYLKGKNNKKLEHDTTSETTDAENIQEFQKNPVDDTTEVGEEDGTVRNETENANVSTFLIL